MSAPLILIWYRNDLRLHDHEPLTQALREGAVVLPVYCFDPRQFGKTSFGFDKTGAFRAQFILECVADLRQSLRSLGSDLIVRFGKPEQIIPELAAQPNISRQLSAVFYHREVTAEELAVEAALATALTGAPKGLPVELKSFWGHTLYRLEDLPFTPQNLPDLFTNFRKQVEVKSTICPELPPPLTLRSLPEGIMAGDIPTLTELGLELPVDIRNSTEENINAIRFQGGETAGIERLNSYFWQQDRLRTYKQTRNGMLGMGLFL